METGWLIERSQEDRGSSPPCWLTVSSSRNSVWTEDSSEALRFARKQDAEALIAHYAPTLGGAIATEHTWG